MNALLTSLAAILNRVVLDTKRFAPLLFFCLGLKIDSSRDECFHIKMSRDFRLILIGGSCAFFYMSKEALHYCEHNCVLNVCKIWTNNKLISKSNIYGYPVQRWFVHNKFQSLHELFYLPGPSLSLARKTEQKLNVIKSRVGSLFCRVFPDIPSVKLPSQSKCLSHWVKEWDNGRGVYLPCFTHLNYKFQSNTFEIVSTTLLVVIKSWGSK